MSLITNLHSHTAQAKHLKDEKNSPYAKEPALANQVSKLEEKAERELQRAAARQAALTQRIQDRRAQLAQDEEIDQNEIKEIDRSVAALKSALEKLTAQPVNKNG